jgi:hypothetical protein
MVTSGSFEYLTHSSLALPALLLRCATGDQAGGTNRYADGLRIANRNRGS